MGGAELEAKTSIFTKTGPNNIAYMVFCASKMGGKSAENLWHMTIMIGLTAYATIRGLWLERGAYAGGSEDCSYPPFLLVIFRALSPLPTDLQTPEQMAQFVQVCCCL